jgi:large subunit ribosomal protein L5
MTTAEEKKPRRPRKSTKAAVPRTKDKTPVQDSPSVNGTVEPSIVKVYREQVTPTMMQEFSYKNVMQVPRLNKIVLNIGVGEAKDNIKALEGATQDLTTLAGQKPIITRARKAIAGFKIREGMPIGVCVTLRGDMMAYFLDRLLNMALPRIRDFRGVSRSSFDGRGNYSMGIREQVIFPEIDYNQIDRIRGFQVTISTTAKTDGEAARLLELLGMPFARQE